MMVNSKSTPYLWALLLALVGFLQRLGFYLVYTPVSFGDTPSYLRLAGVLSSFNFNGYDGTRVPGFPVFLAILGKDPQTIWIVQMGLGWIISMIWFWFTWRTVGSPVLGFVIGCSYNLLPGLFFFEANLLTETLTTFFITLSLGLLVLLERNQRYGLGLLTAFLCGTAASLAGMVRPLFFTLPLWLFPFIWFQSMNDLKRRLLKVGIYSIGPLIILGGWLLFINQKYGMISPTTMGGYNLVQHTGEYFDDLPDEHAAIRDTYIEFRDRQIAERGSQTNAIWDAIPAITQASGLNFYDLSRELQRLSIDLIKRNPDLYLMNAASGWVDFWKAPVYWELEAFHSPSLRAMIPVGISFGRAMTLIANGLFILLSAGFLVLRKVRAWAGFDRFVLLTTGYVWLTSILQTMVDHGDNPRFLLPLQMFVIYVVLRSSRSFLKKNREGRWSLETAKS
jgi:hypothetical protein